MGYTCGQSLACDSLEQICGLFHRADCRSEVSRARSRDGNGSLSHGSPFLDGLRRSWVTASDPLTHDDEIAAQ